MFFAHIFKLLSALILPCIKRAGQKRDCIPGYHFHLGWELWDRDIWNINYHPHFSTLDRMIDALGATIDRMDVCLGLRREGYLATFAWFPPCGELRRTSHGEYQWEHDGVIVTLSEKPEFPGQYRATGAYAVL